MNILRVVKVGPHTLDQRREGSVLAVHRLLGHQVGGHRNVPGYLEGSQQRGS